MSKVLVTGGAGYIGSVLTMCLLEEGHEVTCMDNLTYSQSSHENFLRSKRYNFVLGDVRDERIVKELIRGKEYIIPLAAIVGMPACNRNPADAKSINKEAVLMLNRLREPRQKIIFPTTNSGYGTKTGEVFCTEDTPLEPISLYGTTKAETEKALLSSDDVVTFRLATVFGLSPRMRLDLLVNDFVFRAMAEGGIKLFEPHFKRNYIHINDVARAFVHAMNNFEAMKGLPYNVGLEDANLSKLDLAEKIKAHLPHIKIEFGEGQDPDKRNYTVSNQRIIRAGFLPKFTLDDGIRELILGYREIINTLTPTQISFMRNL